MQPEKRSATPVLRCVVGGSASQAPRIVSYLRLEPINPGGDLYRLQLVYRQVKHYVRTKEDGTLTITTDKQHPSTAFSLFFDEHGRAYRERFAIKSFAIKLRNW